MHCNEKKQHVIGDVEVGEVQNVKWGKKCYKARIAATGKLMFAYLHLNSLKQN